VAGIATSRAGTAPADRSRDARWEFMLQAGRVPAGGKDQREFTRYLCRQLESTAINGMLQVARKSSARDGLLSGGFAGSVFQGLADEEYSRMLAARGGFGLGDQLYRQMTTSAQAIGAYRRTMEMSPAAGNAAQGASQKSDY